MKYDKYIISFFPGSSGRFVGSVLDRIIRASDDPLELCPYNSAHLDKTYFGLSMVDIHRPNIYEVLIFDPTDTKDYLFSKILRTHVYPDFKIINSRFNDVGIILIKPDIDDAIEMLFNNNYKSHQIALDLKTLQMKKYMLFIGKDRDKVKFFQTENKYPKNCLVLNYNDIFEKTGEKYKLLELLSDFTGISQIPEHLNLICKQYITNRSRIVNQYKLR
jgi:hypothetical protein